MSGRRIQFSNPRRLLTEEERLQGLRDRVAAIQEDLDTLLAQSEEERREDAETRRSVLQRFYDLRNA